VKVAELRVLHEEELDGRLKAARRELYELRFKDAVGQLENKSQIANVRHDIARILTVLNERVLGISGIEEAPAVGEAPVAAPKKPRAKRKEFVDEEDAEQEPVEAGDEATEEVAEAEAEPETEEKPKRGRTAKAVKQPKAEKKS
jgi:large subunit ribosomal protein L29